MSEHFLEISELRKTYQVRRSLFAEGRSLHAVAGVSFQVAAGSTFGLVGESGSGKSTIAKMLMLAELPTAGSIRVGGHDLAALSKPERLAFHKRLQPVLQDPYSSLNPRMKIGRIIDEPMRIHRLFRDNRAIAARVAELLDLVGLPADAAQRYPHELSGGQRQRAAIARALGLNPECLILDEPVSALDVSIQAQILNLLKDLQDRTGLTYLLISHDLSVVAYMSAQIGVLYLGQFMELGSKNALVTDAYHPYTRALIASVGARAEEAAEPESGSFAGSRGAPRISGEIPSPMAPPGGCPFHPRCQFAQAQCRSDKPSLRQVAPAHWVACHFAEAIRKETI
jgi:oligopeptide/dipeptide ABC transporter ATP-binding protein